MTLGTRLHFLVMSPVGWRTAVRPRLGGCTRNVYLRSQGISHAYQEDNTVAFRRPLYNIYDPVCLQEAQALLTNYG